ncbi:MAG: hypothetical protein ABEJ56_06930, partial [Candidatus Nanohaloarchaea archaeon]
MLNTATALDLNDTQSLDYWSGSSNLDFRVETDGTLRAQNDIDLNENNITSIDSLLDSTGSKTINFDGSNNVEIPNGNLNMSGGNLNMSYNEIVSFFDNSCGENQAVKEIYDNGTVKCGQAGGGLPTVLSLNNSANQSNITNLDFVDFDSKGEIRTDGTDAITIDSDQNVTIKNGNLDLHGNNLTDSTGGNITINQSILLHGDLWMTDDGSGSGNLNDPYQNLSEVLELSNSAGSYDIDLNGNSLRDVGGVYDDSNTQCGSDEFLAGDGDCEPDSFASDTDNQDLEDVLAQYNDAGAYNINLSG